MSKQMKISEAIQYLNEYQDKDEEIMISWNDKEFLSEQLEQEISDELWSSAVWLHNKYAGESFNDECVLSIQNAKAEEKKESK